MMKNFVKAMDKTQAVFKYLNGNFPRLSETKIKEGVVVGPQIYELLCDDAFDHALRDKEKEAWKAFHLVAINFLGSNKVDNYRLLLENLLKAYKSLVQHVTEDTFLHSHLDFFPPNCGRVSNEHGK